MGRYLALASATAILRSQLEQGPGLAELTGALGADVQLSALPPDRITTGADERPQLNLFLYQVTPHTALGRGERGGGRREGLDLHYLLSAYGAGELQIELMLGYGLRRLGELGALEGPAIDDQLARLRASSPHVAALAALGEGGPSPLRRLEARHQFLALDELGKLWSALQARYRPSVALKVAAEIVYV